MSYPICPSLITYNPPWQTGRGKTGRRYQVVNHVYILLDLLEQSLADLAKGKKLRMTHLLGKLKYGQRYLFQNFFYLKTLVYSSAFWMMVLNELNCCTDQNNNDQYMASD